MNVEPLMPDNTADSWGQALLKLADEAEHDAGEHDTSLALHSVLADLAAVARSYAGRLDVERSPAVAAGLPTPAMSEVIDRVALQTHDTLEAPDYAAVIERLAKLENPALIATNAGVPIAQLPEWLAAALKDLSDRIAALEARANFTTVAPSPVYANDALEVYDDDPSAWDNIDRARNALRRMVMRQHRERAGIRQKILERVSSLARLPDIASNGALQAELRQHEARADELATIDAVCGVKLDEIAGLDDLEVARSYDASKGWPS